MVSRTRDCRDSLSYSKRRETVLPKTLFSLQLAIRLSFRILGRLLVATPSMLEREFFQQVISSESDCLAFLRAHGVLESAPPICECGGKMRESKRKERSGNVTILWKCVRSRGGKRCYKTKSVREWNELFFHRDRNGKMTNNLTLCSITHLLWLFLNSRSTVRNVVAITGHSSETVVDWFSFFRATCGKALELAPKLRGTASSPVQIDESYYSGKRKYSRGRLLSGDVLPRNERSTVEDEDELWMEWGMPHVDDEDDFVSSDDTPPTKTGRKNYGTRISGPWVLGMVQNRKNVRFIEVADRKSETLLNAIQSHVATNSVVVTDEWAGYRNLTNAGYIHESVNHSKEYVNSMTGYHTQTVERVWVEGKSNILRRGRRPHESMQEHLDELSWRLANNGRDLLEAFLSSAIVVHGKRDSHWHAVARDAAYQCSTKLSDCPPKFKCLCDEPVDKIPHYARQHNNDSKLESINPLNWWRIRHMAHDKSCENRNLSRKLIPFRAALLDSYRELPIKSFMSTRPARIPDKRRESKRKRDEVTSVGQ